MQHYEVVLLLNPKDQDCIEEEVRKYGLRIKKSQGMIHRMEGWGVRSLAYPIQDFKKAYYALMNIECDIDTLRRFEQDLNRSRLVIRYILIRKRKAIIEESNMMKGDSAKKLLQDKNKHTTREE